jgi:hypothetical protein
VWYVKRPASAEQGRDEKKYQEKQEKKKNG